MFISADDINTSLRNLSSVHPFFGVSFLAFKRLALPIGREVDAPIAQEERALLDRYYSPAPNYDGYYIPFRASGRRDRWVNSRYPDTTLQRIRSDTFGAAFLHEKKTGAWGWRNDYVATLLKHQPKPVPTLDLAVWLYRDLEFAPTSDAKTLIERFVDDFGITKSELTLFATAHTRNIRWTDTSVSWHDLREIIGPPPGAPAEEGATLGYLSLRGVGPSSSIQLTPGERLTVVTGDNGLGKSFLLECAWYALTGEWTDLPAQPSNNKAVAEALIQYKLGTISGSGETHISRYNWATQRWIQSTERHIIPGLVIFARADGSFAIWDPAKLDPNGKDGAACVLSREEAWEGKRTDASSRRSRVLCGGLLADWTLWENAPTRFPYREFYTAIQRLSPPEIQPPIEPGEPVRIADDVRDIPTLHHPYGDVPVTYASAGIRRIVTIAYLLVWTWFEHRRASEAARRSPQERLVVLIDEVEAHLHPRWQRTIVPALMETIKAISSAVQVQLIVATHSPLVLASIETEFDDSSDKLFHLDLTGEHVTLDEMPFVKYGDVDNWLRSELFGLKHARSVEAEDAIEAAKSLQLADAPSTDSVRVMQERLEHVLSSEDDFWPRWLYFAREHGVSS